MELKNKRVLVVGLGRSGLSAAMFLRDRGARVTVSDTRSATALAKEIPALMEAGIMVESGGHGLLTFRRQDLIVVSPGVPLETPEIAQAAAFGTAVIGELELASRFLDGSVIAITGSNGKTTTTTLTGKIFADAALPTLVGGNIGLPVIDLIAESRPETWSVLEVSSFQLETATTFKPRIAMVLNVTPDHLDRHKTFERYWEAKARITACQESEDFLILNAEDVNAQKMAAKTRAQIYWFSGRRQVKQGAFVHGESVFFLGKEGGKPEPVLPVSEIALKGAHNVENVLAAVCAARLAGIDAETIRAAVKGFRAVEHRLELVRVRNGVEFYNDSKATNVDATVKAVESFAGGIHLILGGKDKDSDYATLSALLKERVRVVYTIGSAAEKIERQLDGVVKIVQAGTLDKAVKLAAEAAVSDEIVLLAPACSSFDQFTNYEERGRVFRDVVLGLD
ncbi:UDP-N-acetylmuramoyl-L-alanine--D-glutamate ligase [Granulicella tundricola]|uniref:UDP-N-acetylmuramoylalanine--D-glutamate ligase n=1 Tax=Granulicella tundricola (strain ATCC BAA-1859 / DSM 23138 / MP5ACTX9) TaxID=1198114 RepID=E8WX94_GRATM|nr:UDP-N-acetylmuramoyl-L-alanine--D-glutamate ligase [Granulicella tundricola]ADW69736.1 UDP-N-acetylmuramoylalanine/D-glutamate ligase [Granulicella tundricola MP5ACTX9]